MARMIDWIQFYSGIYYLRFFVDEKSRFIDDDNDDDYY